MAVEMGTLAVALYDFDGLREDNLPFKAGEIITIIEMNDSGWWKGSIHGRVGIFPYSYVSLRETVGDSFPVCRALHDFDGVNPGDITFKKGTLITLLRELNGDWWSGRLKDGREGTFPASYVELTDLEDVEAAKAEKKRFSKMQKEKQKEADRAAKEQASIERRIAKERAKKRAEEQEQEEKERLRAEATAARERARKAEEELAQIKAESARLQKQEAERKARKSLRMSKRVAEDFKKVQEKAARAADKFQGYPPGPAPELPALPMDDEDDDDIFGKPAAAPPMPSRKTAKEQQDERAAEFAAASAAAADEEEAHASSAAAAADDKPKFKYNSKFANLGGGSRCAKCKKAVGFADKVKAMGVEFHTGCFQCSTCSKVLRQGEWREHNNFPYCERCYGVAHGPKGFGYGGVVTAVSAKAGGPAQSEVDDRPMFDVLKDGDK